MAKVAGFFAKVIAVVFTSVMAPVLVSMALRDSQGGTGKLCRNDQRPPHEKSRALSRREILPPRPAFASEPPLSAHSAEQTSSRSTAPAESPPFPTVRLSPPMCRPAAPPPDVIDVIVHGVGRTPEEALRDGLGTALRQALAAQVDAATWARNGQNLFEVIRPCGGDFLLGWKELGATKEWRLLGTLHHKDLAVKLNRRALLDRLRAVQGPVRCCYPGATGVHLRQGKASLPGCGRGSPVGTIPSWRP